MATHRILHVAAEVHPYLKTGGLADVASALPEAQHSLGHDVRVLMPGYGLALERAHAAGQVQVLAAWPGARLLATTLPHGTPLWLYETQAFRARGGEPYDQPTGGPWPDNAERFDELARLATAIAADRLGLNWRPDTVHSHDWHTGLVPLHLQLARVEATSVFTIHNLAHQGLFPLTTRAALGLPGWLDHWEAMECRGYCSFIKSGIVFADRVTTVSETYASEIRTPAFGEGLDGLLSARGTALRGIPNGIDTDYWNPATDPALPAAFDAHHPEGKRECRAALLTETGLRAAQDMPVIACIGRLATQKGMDLLLEAIDDLIALPAALIVLGSGDPALEQRLQRAAAEHPSRVHARLTFDEPFAHRLYAGADMLTVPSRFEPCGLAQLNAMRYGTIPIVRRTGGLAETVVDTTRATTAARTATGFQFDVDTPAALAQTLRRAHTHYRQRDAWARLIHNAMHRDSSWTRSARTWLDLYAEATTDRVAHLPPA
jgi:starch synthase